MSVLYRQNEIIHYETLGRGIPILFLHTWVGSWRYWMPSMQAVSTSHRAYALDFWGFGDTAKSPEHYSVEQQVELLDYFLNEMGIQKVIIIGHGLGAIVAASFARNNPDRVNRLLLIGLPRNRASINSRLHVESPSGVTAWLLAQSPDGDAVRKEVPKVDRRAIQLSLANLDGFCPDALLSDLATPSLFVYGEDDPLIQAFILDDQVAEIMKCSHQIVFCAAGHFPMLDEPRKFNRLVADFLSLVDGESPRSLQIKDEWKRRVR